MFSRPIDTSGLCAPRRRATRHGSRDERGAAMVEFALVAIALFTLIYGVIEGGLLVRARNATASAADEAARRGAIAGTVTGADYQILQQIESRGLRNAADIDYVVVYNAASNSSAPSPACVSGTPVADECNVYQATAFDLGAAAFDCSDANLDANWCPSDRVDTDFVYLGVYIKARHKAVTGMGLFQGIDLVSQSVLPLEGSAGA